MFGYIKVSKGELRIKEFELYRGVYCTLCKVLGKNYGLISRFTLNYDFTFLALLNMSLKDGCDKFSKKSCTFNPLKKCNFCNDTEDFEMPAAAAMIMTYYKLLDNIADDKGIKKLFFITLKPFIKSANKKAAKKYPYIEKIVADYINKQNTLEKENCTDTDKAADPTAVALAQILMLCSTDTSQKRVLERLGYCLGRYIYLTDAYFDLEQDIKTGSYNVLKNKPTAETENYVKSQIYFCINEATKAFELLDIKKYKTILGNILYLGLEETLQKEIKK
ncbi:MAG: hypothetical protein IJD45_00510 [Clostridia bacterium]|nr:hypothetical protein [Clostridia bacterium]